MTEPVKLSSSSIGTFASCARLFWFNRYSGLEGRDFTSDAIERGSLFHAGIAAALRQTDPLKNLKVATAAVDELYSAGTGSVDERDSAVEMLRYYLDDLSINRSNFAYKLNGVPLVEYEFDVPFEGFSLRGSIDAVIRDSEGHVFCVDWKTRRTPYDQLAVAHDKQLYLYCKILQMEGIELDGAMQIQLSPSVPQPLKFKVDSDISLASSLNERSGKTTKEMFDKSIAHMSASERLLAQLKLGNKITDVSDFKRLSPINLEDVDAVFNTILAWGRKIANETEFLPVLNSFNCKSCQFLVECRASLKVQ